MIREFDKSYVENILSMLDEQNCLFPQFSLTKLNNELKLLGTGGFSSVYEMYNKERPELLFAMKVIGFQKHTISSSEFLNTSRIQWILCQESKYIMRVLDAKELVLAFDENGMIDEVKEATKEAWEETEGTLHLQFVLTEKLEPLIEKDRFANVKMLREKLDSEEEVLKLAFEIGQALSVTHINKCMHRDIKIENIFWDDTEQVYKLGDFGIAKWSVDGNAETIVYTDGYGAPEIERRLYDSYNITADIYSFGITLYLLLNDLKFPGSDGYYSKTEVQYNSEFVFPAPVHASEGMTRVIRKMCSYCADERYQSMDKVLIDLHQVLEEDKVDLDLTELTDIPTEIYEEETEKPEEKEIKKTRAERKEEQEIINILYREDSIKYFLAITLLLILLFKGLQLDSSMVTGWMFFLLPVAVLIEALLQYLKEFHLVFGAAVLVFSMISIYSLGLTVPHIILIACVIIGCPVLSLAGSVSTGLWMILEISGKLDFLNYIGKWDIGWIILIAMLLVVNRYFHMRMEWEKITYTGAIIVTYIYDKMFLVMVLVGIVLFVLQCCHVIVVPDIVQRMHFVRTGIISFIGMCIFVRQDGYLDENNSAKADGEEVAEDDEFLDE